MSDSSKRDLRKVKTACLLALLLLPGIIIALPAVSVFHVSASTGAAPTTVTGATAVIDDPVYGSIGTGAAVTRTIAVTNPLGNPGITTITISIPAGATSASPTGSIPTSGGVPDCHGAPCAAQVFGSGPYSLQYVDTVTSGAVILPAGATILITLAVTPKTTTAVSTAADTFTFSASVTDNTPATTQLSGITVFYTTATGLTGSAPSSTSITAGSTFTYTVSATQSGIPVSVAVVGASGSAKYATISPSTFTTGSTAQTITINYTKVAAALQVTAGVPALGSLDLNGALTNGTQSATTAVIAGSPTKLAVSVYTYSTGTYNVTSTNWASGPIPGSQISISATDKFGNTATPSGSVTLNVQANTASGQTAGFATAGAFATGNPYPYTVSNLFPAISFTFSANPIALSTPGYNFFYGVDYGSSSQIVVTATGATLTAATSVTIKTYTLSTGLLSVASSTSAPKSGASYTLTATMNAPYQANVPVYFFNTTDYSTLTGTSMKALTTINSAGTGVATVSVTAPTKAGTSTAFTADEVVVTTLSPPQTGNSILSNSTVVGPTGTITTTAGSIAKLVVNAYLSGGNPVGTTAPFSSTTYPVSTVVVPKGTMYIDVVTTDANGNPVTVTGVTQVSLSASSGSLSVTTVLTIPNGGYDLASSNFGNSISVAFTPPTTVGTVVTFTATGAGLTGTSTVTVVTATPLLTVSNPPTTVVAGVPTVFSGTVNATKGIFGDTISNIQYSVNWVAGATPTTVTINAANAAWTFSVLLSSTASSSVNITAKDSSGNVVTQLFSVPPIPPAKTFTNSTDLKQVSFVGGPAAVNATFTNNSPTSLTVIIVANVLNAQGAVILESTATVTVAGGATGVGYPVIQGIAHGTYTVSVTVYSTAYVTLSPTTTLSVTV